MRDARSESKLGNGGRFAYSHIAPGTYVAPTCWAMAGRLSYAFGVRPQLEPDAAAR
jgi:hypothetical protein